MQSGLFLGGPSFGDAADEIAYPGIHLPASWRLHLGHRENSSFQDMVEVVERLHDRTASRIESACVAVDQRLIGGLGGAGSALSYQLLLDLIELVHFGKQLGGSGSVAHRAACFGGIRQISPGRIQEVSQNG